MAVIRNFSESSAVAVERTEMGVKLTLGTKSVLSSKPAQVDGWFELDAVEQLIAELQAVVTAVRNEA